MKVRLKLVRKNFFVFEFWVSDFDVVWFGGHYSPCHF